MPITSLRKISKGNKRDKQSELNFMRLVLTQSTIRRELSNRTYISRGKLRRKLELKSLNLYLLKMQRLKGSSNWASVHVEDHLLQ